MPLSAFPALRRSAPTVVNRPGDIHASNTPEPLHPYHYGFQQLEYRPANAKRPCLPHDGQPAYLAITILRLTGKPASLPSRATTRAGPIGGPLTPVTGGLSRSLADSLPRRSGCITGPDGTDLLGLDVRVDRVRDHLVCAPGLVLVDHLRQL